jgi:hypothetical protein
MKGAFLVVRGVVRRKAAEGRRSPGRFALTWCPVKFRIREMGGRNGGVFSKRTQFQNRI